MQGDEQNPGVLGTLEQKYSAATQASAAQEVEALRSLLVENLEPCTVREGGPILPGIMAVVALLCFYQTISTALHGFGLLLLPTVIGLLFAVLALWIFLGWRKPFLTLREEGVEFPVFQGIVPWTAIEDFAVRGVSINFIPVCVEYRFLLAVSFQPAGLGEGRRRMRYNARKCEVRGVLSGLAGRMSAQRFNQLFTRYWQSGCARARLRELGAL